MKHDDEIDFKVTCEESEVHYIEETRNEKGNNTRLNVALCLALASLPSVSGLMLSGFHWFEWKFWVLLLTYPLYGFLHKMYVNRVFETEGDVNHD